MKKSSYDIFVSYRRDGGATLAQLIYDRLTVRGYRVFLDIEALTSGKFDDKVFEIMEHCKDVVVILQQDALERCRNNKEDWIYREMAYALAGHKNIIPVMMSGFRWPEVMPEGLQELKNYNGVQDSKEYFDAVIERIIALMQSKSSVLAVIKRKIEKQREKIRIRNILKAKKRLLIIIGSLLFVVLSAITVAELRKAADYKKLATEMSIQMRPGSEMSASQYDEAVNLLQQRIEILADGYDYEFEAGMDSVDIKMPMEVFGQASKLETSNILSMLAAGSVKTYIMEEGVWENIDNQESDNRIVLKEDEVTFLNVNMEETEKLLPKELNRDIYNLEGLDNVRYQELRLSDAICENIEKAYGIHSFYNLVQIGESFISYYPLIRGKQENQFYLILDYQQENVYKLFQFNYTIQEDVEEEFDYTFLFPVQWQEPYRTDKKGKYQKHINKIEEPYVEFQLELGKDGISDGLLTDVEMMLKNQMDALEAPYAFGETVDPNGNEGFTICTGTDRLYKEMIENIGYSSISLCGAFCNVASNYDIDEWDYEKQESGNYSLTITLKSDETAVASGQFKRACKEIEQSSNHKIYLCWDGKKLFGEDVTEAINYEKNTITFSEVQIFDHEKQDERLKYLLQMIDACLKNMENSQYFYFDNITYQVYSSKTVGEEKGLPSIMEQRAKRYEKIISDIWADAEVQYNMGSFQVHLNLPIDEELPQRANEYIQKIYAACELEQGEADSFDISCVSGGGNSISCTFSPNSWDLGCMTYYGFFYGDEVSPYKKEFQQIVQEDSFYTETVQPSSMGGWDFPE